MPAATPRSSPSCAGGPASTSSPRPGSITSASTDRPTGASGAVEDALADLFVADVDDGIDERDYSGPIVRRTAHPGGRRQGRRQPGRPSARDPPIFVAAAVAHRRTGVPILTHCEAGTGALEQIRAARRPRRPRRAHLLSHVDKVVDRGYHRELLATGAFVEYDQAFRWGDGPNGTLELIEWMVEDGLADRVVLGMDAARARATTASSVARPGSPGCSMGSRVALEARRRRRGHPPSAVRGQSSPCIRVRRGRSMSREPLLTSVVGSHARPSWFVSGIAAAERGEFGPVDLEEMLDDAVDLAIRDQEEAGVDIVSDGEMRRAGFFTAEFYRHVTGVGRAATRSTPRRRRRTTSSIASTWSSRSRHPTVSESSPTIATRPGARRGR